MDCTHKSQLRSLSRALIVCLLLTLGFGWLAAAARADGDPASDVLPAEPLFLPQDAGVSSTQAAQLQQLLREARRAGYPIRVALIASAADLGSVTELWRKPQIYAEFLAQELALIYHGPLLIVMPNGIGFQAPRRRSVPTLRLPAGVRRIVPGANLGTTAITVIRQLTAAAGHPLALPTVHTKSHSSTVRTIEDTVFLVGLAICIVAFLINLRARPLSLQPEKTSSS